LDQDLDGFSAQERPVGIDSIAKIRAAVSYSSNHFVKAADFENHCWINALNMPFSAVAVDVGPIGPSLRHGSDIASVEACSGAVHIDATNGSSDCFVGFWLFA